MKIGIIGQGYVGTAIKIGFKEHYDIETYDKFDLTKSTRSTIKDIVDRTDIIFVCVPTPMRKDGTCYTGIVEEVIREINETADGQIIVIKSTVPPGTTDRINQEYTRSTVIFNPEFLTEANFLEDFKNQSRIILGTKVSFANEMYSVCEQVGIDYDKVVEYATYDERLGKSHWAVPGPDEDFGFGGHCLPKDLSAIINEFKTYGLLESVEQVNDQVRENRDWEHMVGRAVLEEE
jgi:UDPglucose 6-dehydrogenase